MPSRLRSKDVFINCLFDDTYKPTFEAILFAVYYLGFAARCALEIDDASELRLEKIMRLIGQCAYGVHRHLVCGTWHRDQPAKVQHAA